MPRDVNGNYTLPNEYVAIPNTVIAADQHNLPLEDIAQALSESLVADGRKPMSGSLKMGGNKIVNAGNGTAPTDVATVGQIPSLSPGKIFKVTRYTSSTTHNYDPATTHVLVKVQGAGGGGGGVDAPTYVGAAGGGGAGGYCEAFFVPGAVMVATITIGTGGPGGVGGAAGTTGGATTYSDASRTITASGGSGGQRPSAANGYCGRGGNGGSGTTGDWLLVQGAQGSNGIYLATDLALIPGQGASSRYGSGGTCDPSNGGTAAGTAASGRGAGGGGASTSSNDAAANGGAGSGGIIEIWEYK